MWDNLVKVNEEKFTNEKLMQKFVEANLDVLFSDIEFVDTEVIMDDYRFDTLAFNPQQKSFVIIEYKNISSRDLIGQGLSYLHKLKNKKGEVILHYNTMKNQSLGMKDIVLDKTRVIFIAPGFTKRQKDASKESEQNIELYEIKRYQNGIVTFNKLGGPDQGGQGGSSRAGKRNGVKKFDEEDYLEGKYGGSKIPTATRDLWVELRKTIDEYFTDIKYEQQKSFGSYVVNNKLVCRLVAKQKYIRLFYRTQDKSFLAENEFVEWKGRSKKDGMHVSIIKNTEDGEKALPLIKKVYNSKKQ